MSNLQAKIQFKSPCNHETATPISHRRAEVTSGAKCVQHDTARHAALLLTPLPPVLCNSSKPASHFFTHSLDTQPLYRAENQWGPRAELSGSPSTVHRKAVL